MCRSVAQEEFGADLAKDPALKRSLGLAAGNALGDRSECSLGGLLRLRNRPEPPPKVIVNPLKVGLIEGIERRPIPAPKIRQKIALRSGLRRRTRQEGVAQHVFFSPRARGASQGLRRRGPRCRFAAFLAPSFGEPMTERWGSVVNWVSELHRLFAWTTP